MKRKIRVRDRDRSHGKNKILDSYLTDAFVGILVADEVKALSGALRLTVEETVALILPMAEQRSIAPVSSRVTATACRCSSGSLYFGCQFDIKLENHDFMLYPEQMALANALSNGETDIRAFISSQPVHNQSLRYINEWNNSDEIQITYPGCLSKKLNELLPGDYDLLYKKPIKKLGLPTEFINPETQNMLIKAAYHAYFRSHSPYSKLKAGIAIEGLYQKYFCGSFIQSTADHDGLNPLILALGNMLITGQTFNAIKKVQLVIQDLNSADMIAQTKDILKTVTNIEMDIIVTK